MNMYNNKLVATIKHKGKVLREFKDVVQLPFGSEYSIYIKNLNSVRALVKIEIDGEDISDGTKFIVEPNNYIEIERYLKNGNLAEGNRFKFIERTSAIEQHRGAKAEDGIVRVEFWFEDKFNSFKDHTKIIQDGWWKPPNTWGDGGYCGSPTYGNETLAKGNVTTPLNVQGQGIADNVAYNASQAALCSVQTNSNVDLYNDVGITVPGSISNQQFQQGAWFPTESTSQVIILKLLGETKSGKQVKKAVTVKFKPKCTTCGRLNKATAKFCTECGTSLKIV